MEGVVRKLAVVILFLFAEEILVAKAAIIDDGDLAVCARIQIPPSRLACYDRLLAAPAAQQEVEWQILKDREGVTLRLQAGKNPKARMPVQLVIRCQPAKTEVSIQWGEPLFNEGRFPETWSYVSVQIGEGLADRQKWALSEDSRTTFLLDYSKDLLNKISATDRLIVQAIPGRQPPIPVVQAPITAEFTVHGLKTVQPFLETTCK
jgi:hypothetical protein